MPRVSHPEGNLEKMFLVRKRIDLIIGLAGHSGDDDIDDDDDLIII